MACMSQTKCGIQAIPYAETLRDYVCNPLAATSSHGQNLHITEIVI